MTRKNKSTPRSFEKQLVAACRGLVYISETDSSVEPFFTDAPTNSNCIEIAFDKFFDRLTEKKEWHSKAARQNAERFARLKDLLTSELDDVRVYKSGKIQIEIVIAGKDKDGRFAGVKIQAVET